MAIHESYNRFKVPLEDGLSLHKPLRRAGACTLRPEHLMPQLRLHALQQRLQLLGLALRPHLQLLHHCVELSKARLKRVSSGPVWGLLIRGSKCVAYIPLQLLITLLKQKVRVGRGGW